MNRRVGDDHAVVLLVKGLDPVEDVDRLGQRRLIHEDRLEPPFQSSILLDVLPILVQRCRADALNLSASQRRLEDVRCIDRAFCRAGADERVQLVDE